MYTIRLEKPEDLPEVRAINERAFGQNAEADLVDALRRACPDVLSLVAEDEGRVVGHILFSPVVIENPDRDTRGMGLAPMAVHPDRQRQGVGSALVKRGLEILRDRECPFVIVIGHPEYYPRFGFELAARYDLKSQWDGVPEEAFMVLVMEPDVMRGISGLVRYRDEFEAAA